MNIIIGDDEELVRISLVSMIQEMEASWEIIGEAAHGHEMVELLSLHKPEVAIIDIRMPEMDGLEAIRRGKTLSPNTKWIIISGFSDFRYAREALQLGVTEYLLKPVVPEELEKAINCIGSQNKEYASLLNRQFETQLFSLCQGLISLDTEPQINILRTGVFQANVYYFDSSMTTKQLEALHNEISHAIHRHMPNYLSYGVHLASFSLTGFEYLIVGVHDPSNKEAGKCILAFLDEAEQLVSGFREDKVAITMIASEVCSAFGDFLRHLQDIQRISAIRTVHGINRKWLYKDMKQLAEAGIGADAAKMLVQLTHDYKNKLYLGYLHTLKGFSGLLMLSKGMLDHLERYVEIVFGVVLSGDNPNESIRKLEQCGEKLLRQQGNGEPPTQDLINQVIAYVELHYMNNIGLSQIAGDLNITPSYLSTLFHRKTGTTFIKYLTRLRILKAKELLSNSNLQVQQVAEQVGYYSNRHFTKLFVEIVGVYPSEFKREQK